MMEEESDFALEGTIAHAMAESKLTHQPFEYEGHELVSDEMEEYVQSYVDYVLEKWEKVKANTPAFLHVEARLDMTKWVKDCFGTADAVVYGGDELEIIDLKYGKGVEVSAEHNTQLMMYALAVDEMYRMFDDIKIVRLTIVQPRLGNLSTWTLPVEELRRWGDEVLRPTAAMAYVGEGETKAGAHCRFCKLKGRCRALYNHALNGYLSNPNVELLSDEELGKALEQIDAVEMWAKGVKELALKHLMSGGSIPGFKVVEGVSRRRYTDETAILTKLVEVGYSSADVCKAPQLKGITDLSKLMGKKKFDEIVAPMCEKPMGAPTIARADDKRGEYDASKDFNFLINQ